MRIIGDTDGIISEDECKKINSQIIEILRSYNLTVVQARYALQSAGYEIEVAYSKLTSGIALKDCFVDAG